MNTFPLHGRRRAALNRKIQQGLTIVEIMVAMVLMLLVTLATVALYSVNSQSYKTVDASQELNDSARFAFELIGQSLRIAGYQEFMHKSKEVGVRAGEVYVAPCLVATPPCPIIGYDNSTIPDASIATLHYSGTKDNGGVNFSDTLAVTFAGSGVTTAPATTADKSVVDCQGVAQASPTSKDDMGLSLFWIRMIENEPQLSCISRGVAGAAGVRNSQTLVRGMETFQVMYGKDDAPSDPDVPSTLLPGRWISARDFNDTTDDWSTVRAVRIGFVLRGPPGSAQRPVGTAPLTTAERTFWPLGRDFTGGSTEAGLVFVAPDDGRLRRAYSTTFMLRNGF